jgi:sugar-specific transcriptional regulator TrmB
VKTVKDLEEVVAKLKEVVGLNGYEARAYLSLLRLGRARPLDIARGSRIPPQRIYDVLRSLVEKGFAVESNGVYMAVRPREALASISRKVIVEAEERARRLEKLGEELERFFEKTEAEGLGIVYGLKDSVLRAVGILTSCEEPPMFMTYKAAERLTDFLDLFSYLLNNLKEDTLIIAPLNVNVPDDVMELLRRRGIRLIRSKFSILDFMIACDTVILGLPYGTDDVVSVIIKNRMFADALKKRLKELIVNTTQ